MRVEIELKNYRCFPDEAPARWTLGPGFTALVGTNNSGKSSLLRFFHEFRRLFQALAAVDARLVSASRGEFQGWGDVLSVADQNEVFCNANRRDLRASFSIVEADHDGRWPSKVTATLRRQDRSFTLSVEADGRPIEVQDWTGTGAAGAVVFEQDAQRQQVHYAPYQELFRDLANSIYLGPFRNAVNIGTNTAYYDLQIGQAFISQWDGWRLGPDRELNRRALAVEAELRRLFELNTLEINAAPGDATMHLNVDGEPYQLQEQGAGLAQFLVVLANVATRNTAWVFIDEPEANLHPSLQIDFLTTLGSYASQGVAFASHSIGLARSAASEVFSIRVLADGRREVGPLSAPENLAQLLGELSYSGYQEMGFSLLLLVEGTTDVPVIQTLLRRRHIEHEVVLMPLGGATLINAASGAQLAELKRLTDAVAVLIDSERTAPGEDLTAERQAFVKACEALEFETHVLERRAMENYWSDRAVKLVKGPKYGALGHFEPRESKDPVWSKAENWQIAAEMSDEDLAETDLGVFLDRVAALVAARRKQRAGV